jgi:hypothetical protein
MKRTIRIAFLLIALVTTTIGYAGPLDGTWSAESIKMRGGLSTLGLTLVFRNDGADVTVSSTGHSERSFKTDPLKYGVGVQWNEAGGGAITVVLAELQGDKLWVRMSSRGADGRSGEMNYFLKRVSK